MRAVLHRPMIICLEPPHGPRPSLGPDKDRQPPRPPEKKAVRGGVCHSGEGGAKRE